MSDIFTQQIIPINEQIGMSIKNLRIENKVTAKSIIEKFDRASSYISKLESGEIKKIDTNFLIQLLNFITDSDEGLKIYLQKISTNYQNYSNETKLIIMNLDDLVVQHVLSKELVNYINNYMEEHYISCIQLIEKINSNEDICDRNDYILKADNIWTMDDSKDILNVSIKLNIPISYLLNLINGEILYIHRVIAEGIIYNLYKLGNEENAREQTINILQSYKINYTIRNFVLKDRQIDDFMNSIDPDMSKALEDILNGLKLMASITKNYGRDKIYQISTNMHEDLGFYFAYMGIDITSLAPKSKETKSEFLKEVKKLIEKYSQNDYGIDIYE